MPRLNPLTDFAFQKALGEKGDGPQLIAFLNAVLCRTEKHSILVSHKAHKAHKGTKDARGKEPRRIGF